jgi:hypothetical protein
MKNMNDIELAALTELVEADRLLMEAENEQRRRNDYAPAYSGDVKWSARDKLEEELKRRDILKA